MQYKEYSDANSELFKEDYDAVLHENTCIIGLCELISASLDLATSYLICRRRTSFPGC